MRPPSLVKHHVSRFRSGQWTEQEDHVASEEPMETRLVWEEQGRAVHKSIAITMRTPGDDFQLAAGFLHGEAIVKSLDDVVDISYCLEGEEPQELNVVSVTLRPGLTFDAARLERHFYTTSSCGVCGKAAIDALEIVGCQALAPSDFRVRASVLLGLPRQLREAQETFSRTGGLHAAGLFDGAGRLLGVERGRGAAQRPRQAGRRAASWRTGSRWKTACCC